nr:MAG TPA: hypothetical protein [Caudoviricetes sp.]
MSKRKLKAASGSLSRFQHPASSIGEDAFLGT